MTKNIRRFSAVLSLTLMLAGTPAMAAPTRDAGGWERNPIVKTLKRLAQRLLGLTPSSEGMVGPYPAPSTPNP